MLKTLARAGGVRVIEFTGWWCFFVVESLGVIWIWSREVGIGIGIGIGI